MARGITIANSMRETVICMSAAFRPEEIRTYTDVSKHQQSCILKLWKETGSSILPPDTASRRGQPQHLSAEEVFVSNSLSALKLIMIHDLWLIVIVSPQLCESYMRHLPWWASRLPGSYLWYPTFITHHLADTEASWIHHEEGISHSYSCLANQ